MNKANYIVEGVEVQTVVLNTKQFNNIPFLLEFETFEDGVIEPFDLTNFDAIDCSVRDMPNQNGNEYTNWKIGQGFTISGEDNNELVFDELTDKFYEKKTPSTLFADITFKVNEGTKITLVRLIIETAKNTTR